MSCSPVINTFAETWPRFYVAYCYVLLDIRDMWACRLQTGIKSRNGSRIGKEIFVDVC